MREFIEANYYNEDLKKRYLNEKEENLSITSNYIDVQFRKVSETECELDKDVSNWTVYEIIEYYKLLNVTSFESLMCLNSIFSQYTQFCLENSLVRDNQNHFLECTKEVLLGCLNKAILDKKMVDRSTVLKWVDELPNPKDQFVLLSLFEYGKSKDFKDIVYASQDNVNDDNTLKLTDRTVNISNKLIEIIRGCKMEDTYYSISGNGTKTMPLIDYGYIVKSYPNQNMGASDFQKGRNIYIACQRIFDYLGIGEWMSPNSVSEAGKLYMIKERAKELNITPMQYLYSNNINEVELQFGCNITRSVYGKKYNEYLV